MLANLEFPEVPASYFCLRYDEVMNHSDKIPENLLLKAITRALSRYIAETDPHVLFNGLLDTLLELTASEYGFIGEVFYTKDQTPFITQVSEFI